MFAGTLSQEEITKKKRKGVRLSGPPVLPGTTPDGGLVTKQNIEWSKNTKEGRMAFKQWRKDEKKKKKDKKKDKKQNKKEDNGAEKQERAEAREEQFDQIREQIITNRWPIMILLIVSLVTYGILKFTGVIGGKSSIFGDLPQLDAAASHDRVRACMATETLCPGKTKCKGANGQLSSGAATTPDGDTCCTFKCESETIPVRVCKPSERLCPPWSACRMGVTVTGVNAVTPTGESCCTFDCNSKEVETRDCFSSETLCPKESLCYGYTGSVSQPSAQNGYGVCCAYSGENDPCTL